MYYRNVFFAEVTYLKLLVTGGCGFIGSNFIRYMLEKYPHYKIINLDKLTYAGNPANLKDIENNRTTLLSKATSVILSS
jgi:dTDP-D-glucose 4,6-dehydratase